MYERDDAPAAGGDEAPPIADHQSSDDDAGEGSDGGSDHEDGSDHGSDPDSDGEDDPHDGGEEASDDASTIMLDDAREEVAEGDGVAGGDDVAEGDAVSEGEESDAVKKSPPHFSSDDEEEKEEEIVPAGSNGDASHPAACWRFGAGRMCDGRFCFPCREALCAPKRRRIEEPIEEPKSEPKAERLPSTRLEHRASDGKLAACL